ncbi:hypothetical protein Csp2054_05180 [Curtobacterium sp. 'Ferrero']|uniref:hypothetical protein n=1 Tax=Curtobacterium sp. 'Ferrero' TaxID=2033654 RepID=UPI000BCAA474|nr:hypothetical protein [Curtobacterium sp. 'Ferrero']PCN48956.1 hypothetical protein Csp2054_05180 [Curtobacterium sp. 'Ferrero']
MSKRFSIPEEHESALHFLVLVEEATDQHIASAVAATIHGGMFKGLGLAHVIGFAPIGSDLERLGFATRRDGVLVPTAAGIRTAAKLAKAAEAPPAPQSVIVGIASEPVFYTQILQELADRADVLVVDRFLGAADVVVLGQLHAVRRVLTGSTRSHSRGERSDAARRDQLAIAVGSLSDVRVRFSTELHDRYMLPSDGKGLMLGGSLGGRKITAAVELSEPATRHLRAEFDAVWDRSSPVEGVTPPAA